MSGKFTGIIETHWHKETHWIGEFCIMLELLEDVAKNADILVPF